MHTTTRTTIAAIICLSGFAAAGCSTATPRATPSAPTITRTVTAAPSTTATPAPQGETGSDTDTTAETEAADATTADTRSDTPCGPYPDAAAKISAATQRIAPPNRDRDWRWATTRSDMSSCKSLSWAELTTAGGTGSSADQLLLFGRAGQFLGTGIKCNVAFQEVTGSGSDFVNVTYRYLRSENESNAGASGRAYATFRWNGSRVVMEGTLPYEVTRGEC